MKLSCTKALSLVELILALGIVLVALVSGIALAGEALKCAGALKHRQLELAQARLSLTQLRQDLSTAKSWQATSATQIAFSDNDDSKYFWQIDSATGQSALRRGSSQELSDTASPELYLAASDIIGLTATTAGTLAITYYDSKSLDKITTAIKKWGQTLQ